MPVLVTEDIDAKPLGTDSATDPSWIAPRELDGLYTRIVDDLRDGRPLIAVTFCGQWDSSKVPEDDIHWGTRFGPWRMFARAQHDEQVRSQYTHWTWEAVLSEQAAADPIRTAIFKLSVNPNAQWRELGVTEAFDIYHVMFLYRDREVAAVDMVTTLRSDEGRSIELAGGEALDLAAAQIVGYNGHNFFYDGPYDGLNGLTGTPDRPKGGFVIGCNTAEYFRDSVVDTNIYGLLFTTSFMAPEGYNLLAMLDGIAQGKSGREICEHCNAAYRHFQVLGGQPKPGPLFVNHAHRLFDS